MKFNFEKLISKNTSKISVSRKSTGEVVDGEWVQGLIRLYQMNLLITTTRKEDLQYLNVGQTTKQIIKIRQLKTDLNQIQLNDTFEWRGYKFRVNKEKLYSDDFSDFKTFYAITEGDAIGE